MNLRPASRIGAVAALLSIVALVGVGFARAAAARQEAESASAANDDAAGQAAADFGLAVARIVQSIVEGVESTVNAELDPERNLAVARERWSLSEEEARAVRPLLVELRDAHRGGGGGHGSEEDRWSGLFERIESRAVETLGEERGKAFAVWAREKHAGLGPKIEARLRPVGETIARTAHETASRVVEQVLPRVRQELERAGPAVESIAKDAAAEVRRALSELAIEVPAMVEEADGGARQRWTSRIEVDGETIAEAVRRAVEESRRATEEALPRLQEEIRRSVEEAARERSPRAEEVQRRVETVIQDFVRSHQEGDRVREDAIRRAVEEAARGMQTQAEEVRRGAEGRADAVRRAYEERVRAGEDRLRAIERDRVDRMRAERAEEGAVLRQTREELERLRRRVEELERELGERAATRPARSRI